MTGRVRFAEFTFDAGTGELWSGSVRVPLEHQPSLVLGHLVASAGRVVTRDDLAAVLWGTGTHVAFDDGLNYCIRQVRSALGDDAKAPRFIATLPRRGYRFVAAVTSEPARRQSPARIAMAAAIAALLVLTVVLETRPNNNHHEIAVAVARTVHGLIF